MLQIQINRIMANSIMEGLAKNLTQSFCYLVKIFHNFYIQKINRLDNKIQKNLEIQTKLINEIKCVKKDASRTISSMILGDYVLKVSELCGQFSQTERPITLTI